MTTRRRPDREWRVGMRLGYSVYAVLAVSAALLFLLAIADTL